MKPPPAEGKFLSIARSTYPRCRARIVGEPQGKSRQFALEVLTEPLATHTNPFLPFIPIRNAMFIAVLQVPSRVMVSEVCASPDALSGTLAPTMVTAVVFKLVPAPVVEMHTNVGKTAVIVLGTCPMLFPPPNTNPFTLNWN
jgi:hypothetical protein